MKKLLDIFVSLFAILVLIFPFIVISILIKFDSKGPILHFLKRMALNNKIFEVPKFRKKSSKNFSYKHSYL
jgi:O-antigen biosynthesis protein WbqP